ncbi:MAG: HIT family protein [Candidatus Woesearchaeota archaeon]
MTECRICTIIESKEIAEKVKIYEDEICIALLSTKPASIAHTIIFPKKHYTIIEQVPDNEIKHMFQICNKISRAMFESLNIQGTNILVQNGIPAGQEEPHFSINIIARREGDGMQLEWKPKQLSQEELSTIELQYKKYLEEPSVETIKKQEILKSDEKSADNPIDKLTEDDDEENYLVKYFNRMP